MNHPTYPFHNIDHHPTTLPLNESQPAGSRPLTGSNTEIESPMSIGMRVCAYGYPYPFAYEDFPRFHDYNAPSVYFLGTTAVGFKESHLNPYECSDSSDSSDNSRSSLPVPPKMVSINVQLRKLVGNQYIGCNIGWNSAPVVLRKQNSGRSRKRHHLSKEDKNSIKGMLVEMRDQKIPWKEITEKVNKEFGTKFKLSCLGMMHVRNKERPSPWKNASIHTPVVHLS